MKRLSFSRMAVGSALVLSCAAAAAVWAAGGGDDVNRLHVRNQTRALNIESVTSVEAAQAGAQRKTARFAVTVRNGYDKAVASYSIRVEDGSTGADTVSAVERGGYTDGWQLPPGATDVARVSTAPEGEVVLTVLAVIFEDGDGDGDADALARLRGVRAGVKLAYQQIIPILQRASNEGPAAAPEAAIQSLEDEVSLINDREVPSNLRRGFVQARDFVAYELKEIRAELRSGKRLKYSAEVGKKLEKIEKALTKL